MLAFGLIVIVSFWRRMKGSPFAWFPSTIIGATYLIFGTGAFLATKMDPFFLVFIVPGILVLAGSLPARAS